MRMAVRLVLLKLLRGLGRSLVRERRGLEESEVVSCAGEEDWLGGPGGSGS